MKIKEISYRRVCSLGNYETATLEAVADVLENESFEEAYEKLKKQVEGCLFAQMEA
jgi:hypothetical protein